MPVKINFREGQDITVDGEPEEVASKLRAGGPVRLTTTRGGMVFVNWSNVLYIEEGFGPAVVEETGRPDS